MSEPTKTTEHLQPNRQLILSRALLAGATGLIPVPYIDDLLGAAVRSQLIRKLAESRQLPIDANAVETLAHPAGSRVLTAAGLGALALGGTKRVFRKLAGGILFVRRVDEAVQTFYLGTLFDHYCARHHTGVGLDGQRAAILRAVIDLAADQARNETVTRAFKKGVRTVQTAATALPRTVADRLRKQPPGVETKADGSEAGADEGIDRAAQAPDVGRASAEVEAEVIDTERGYVLTLIERFDLAWAAANAPRPGAAT